MRHAKAEGYAEDDKSRELTERGRQDAAEAGSWLAAHDVRPDRVLVSSASRTVETWQCVNQVLGTSAEVEYVDALYSAGPATALEVIRSVPEDAVTVLVIGHNPTVAFLAHVLGDGTGDPDAFRDMSEGYPTTALTVLEVPVPWCDLAEGSSRITAFHVGHGD